jgi:thiamine biosynthesis lipoprotein
MSSGSTAGRPGHPGRRSCLTALLGAAAWPGVHAVVGTAPGRGAAAGAHAPPTGPGPAVVHHAEPLFGSLAELVVVAHALATGASGDSGAPALHATCITDAVAEVLAGWRRMNREWNAWKDGELGRLNRQLMLGRPPGARPLAASAALRALIRRAAALEQASAGLFNPALGAVVAGWGFHADELRPGAPPAAAQQQRWLNAAPPSLAHLVWQGDELLGSTAPLCIDLGGIAKGAAADWALLTLRRHGLHDALVNLGGNVATMGQARAAALTAGIATAVAAAATAWQIGIRDARHAHADPAGLLASLAAQPAGPAAHEAVVTSGQYERWRQIGVRQLGHIIDPATMAPAPGLGSVTVVHPDASLADAAATALLVAGPQRWPALAGRLGVDQVLVQDGQGGSAATARLAARLRWADATRQARCRVV